jgi:pyruvate dehydrogenase E2 component (dihydrolipoamide acetyltransferase)
MAIVVEMPRLTDTMDEGVLVSWRKNEGDSVAVDDVLGEVETDKATMELAAFDRGVMLKQLIHAGDSVPPGAPIAILGKSGEDISALLAKLGATASAPPVAKPAADAQGDSVEPDSSTPTIPVDVDSSAAGAGEAHPAPRDPSGRVLASPLARRMAREQGVDLAALHGSGPNGRIVARDLSGATKAAMPRAPSPPARPLAASAAAPAPAAKKEAAPEAPAAHRTIDLPEPHVADGKVVPLSMMRKTIARRLTDSKSGIPHYYVTMAFDADPLVEFRARTNADSKDVKVSINDLLIKTCARALKAVPQINASWSDKGIVLHQRVDIGIAVAMEEGLITPVVRDADKKTLGEIAGEVHDLVTRARARRLKPEEYRHGTFSISNLGMFGVSHFAAVINPPEAAILAVGAVQRVPVVRGDAVVPGHVLKVTMSCDHRVVDGAVAAHFLATLRDTIEHPMRLVL